MIEYRKNSNLKREGVQVRKTKVQSKTSLYAKAYQGFHSTVDKESGLSHEWLSCYYELVNLELICYWTWLPLFSVSFSSSF